MRLMPTHFEKCNDAICYAAANGLRFVYGWLSGADRILYAASNGPDRGRVLYWENDGDYYVI